MARSFAANLIRLGSVLCLAGAAHAIPYSDYILAPSTRDLAPVSVYNFNGSVSNAAGLTVTGSGDSVFHGASAVTYDYSKSIGGIVSFVVSASSGGSQSIGLSFTESSLWISPTGSDATQNVAIDETLWFNIHGPGNYSVQPLHNRGSFRYLNVYHNGTGHVTLTSLTTHFNAMPHFAEDELRNYTGYFHTNDERLNRVWYAAAYTDQLCTIPSTTGFILVNLLDSDPSTPAAWWSNSTLTNGTSALVDGGKRDRLLAPGDYSISVPGVLLTTNDAYTIKLSLQQCFAGQNATTGQLPYAPTPLVVQPASFFFGLVSGSNSFTYHLHTLLGLSNYYVYTGDLAYVQENWDRIKLAVSRSLSFVDGTGLANVTSPDDWLRVGMGGHNIEANAILAYTLDSVIALAYAVDDLSQIASWAGYSAHIKIAANNLLWDSAAGFYKDNETTTLHPQDGNCWAVISGIANTSRAAVVSDSLAARWTHWGPPAPEAGATISPYITGFELQAHFLAGKPQRAIELMQFMWADFMLDDPRMTNSTFNEGYDTSGELHYPAYADDARISHAHGWSTGPIIALTNYVAGLHVSNSTHWVVYPQPGNLTEVDAGFTIDSGTYTAKFTSTAGSFQYAFSTPLKTTGSLMLDLPGCSAGVQLQCTGSTGFKWGKHVSSSHAQWSMKPKENKPYVQVSNGSLVIDGLHGGNYSVSLRCS